MDESVKMKAMMREMDKMEAVAKRVHDDLMSLETFEAYKSVLLALTDEWCARHKINPTDFWRDTVEIVGMVNELEPYELAD